MGPLFREHFRDHQVNISSLNPPPGGHAHHFWFMHVLSWILFNTYFISGTFLAEAPRVSMLAITGVSSVICSSLCEEFRERPFAPAPSIFSRVSVASVTFSCPVLVLLVYLSLLLALNIPLPHGQKELDLQEATHTYSPCQPNLKQAQLCDQQPLFLVLFLVCDLGLYFFLRHKTFLFVVLAFSVWAKLEPATPPRSDPDLGTEEKRGGQSSGPRSFILPQFWGTKGSPPLPIPFSGVHEGEHMESWFWCFFSTPHPNWVPKLEENEGREADRGRQRHQSRKMKARGEGWRRIRDKALVLRGKKERWGGKQHRNE